MTTIINGIIPGKKNNKMLVKIGGRTVPITKPETQKRLAEITAILKYEKIDYEFPVRISMTFYISDKRRRDLDNMAS